ncbi:hypothetical protein KW796_02460 [Candidatus Parcubacteria bacterium]|nr:hypothetical protein [Candidatus Parcubacteria bacterium]
MPPQQHPKLRPELGNQTIALMISVALFFDALQGMLNFLLMGWLVSPVALLTFWLWFRLHGIKFTSAKRIGIMGGGFILEMIPMINTLPAWTLAVSLVALDAKIKKKLDI